MPTTPVCEAGRRVEPPASVPSARMPIPAATADAAPPDDPPGVRDVSQGLEVVPCRGFVVTPLQANSEQLVEPSAMAPALRNLATAMASAGATKPRNRCEPLVAGCPSIHR